MTISDLFSHAYTPYSKKNSVAIVRSASGSYFPGCRIENIAYPLSITAIQNALFCCISEGESPEEAWTTDQNDPIISYWEQELEVSIQQLKRSNLSDIVFPDIRLRKKVDPQKKLVHLLDQAVVGESDFPVAALLETADGFYSGVNIECSAWSMGLCAERVAISKALSYGHNEFRALHIHTRDGEFSSPCGACRQVIIEHMPDKQIHLHHADHSTSIHFSMDLLPHSFRSSSLTD